MKSADFIAAARYLADIPEKDGLLECSLRRATSTAYYALFHCLAESCANMLVGNDAADRNRPEWNQAYRALEHGTLRNRQKSMKRMEGFCEEIRNFMSQLVSLQERRHSADYDPDAVGFERSAVRQAIGEAEQVIRRFKGVPVEHRRAFAVYVLTIVRKDFKG